TRAVRIETSLVIVAPAIATVSEKDSRSCTRPRRFTEYEPSGVDSNTPLPSAPFTTRPRGRSGPHAPPTGRVAGGVGDVGAVGDVGDAAGTGGGGGVAVVVAGIADAGGATEPSGGAVATGVADAPASTAGTAGIAVGVTVAESEAAAASRVSAGEPS